MTQWRIRAQCYHQAGTSANPHQSRTNGLESQVSSRHGTSSPSPTLSGPNQQRSMLRFATLLDGDRERESAETMAAILSAQTLSELPKHAKQRSRASVVLSRFGVRQERDLAARANITSLPPACTRPAVLVQHSPVAIVACSLLTPTDVPSGGLPIRCGSIFACTEGGPNSSGDLRS